MVNPDELRPTNRQQPLAWSGDRAVASVEKIPWFTRQEHGNDRCVKMCRRRKRYYFSLSNEGGSWRVVRRSRSTLPMDIEWAKDGHTGIAFIAQAITIPAAR